MILLRSILFNLLFYLNLLVHLLLAMPTLVMPYWAVVAVAKMWGRTNLWLLRHACGLDVEWRGLEKIPPGGIIVAAKHQSAVLEPKDPHTRALAHQWMDWQLSVMGPAITPVFWGMIRTPPAERNHKAIDEGKVKTTAAVKMLDEQFAKTPYAAGDAFSMGDIPIAIMSYRYRELVPERPALPNFERWYAAIAARPAFAEHVSSIPLT